MCTLDISNFDFKTASVGDWNAFVYSKIEVASPEEHLNLLYECIKSQYPNTNPNWIDAYLEFISKLDLAHGIEVPAVSLRCAYEYASNEDKNKILVFLSETTPKFIASFLDLDHLQRLTGKTYVNPKEIYAKCTSYDLITAFKQCALTKNTPALTLASLFEVILTSREHNVLSNKRSILLYIESLMLLSVYNGTYNMKNILRLVPKIEHILEEFYIQTIEAIGQCNKKTVALLETKMLDAFKKCFPETCRLYEYYQLCEMKYPIMDISTLLKKEIDGTNTADKINY